MEVPVQVEAQILRMVEFHGTEVPVQVSAQILRDKEDNLQQDNGQYQMKENVIINHQALELLQLRQQYAMIYQYKLVSIVNIAHHTKEPKTETQNVELIFVNQI